MHFRNLLVLGIAPAVVAFGSHGLNPPASGKIPPVEVTTSVTATRGQFTVVNGTADQNGQTMSTIEFTPAPELPARPPDAGGAFNGLDGKNLALQSFMVVTTGTLESGVAGITFSGIASGGAAEGHVMVVSGSVITDAIATAGVPISFTAPADLSEVTVFSQGQITIHAVGSEAPADAKPVFTIGTGLPIQPTSQKVVTTNATKIYRDVTPSIITNHPSSGTQIIQQVLEPGSLDKLTQHTMVTVWGHKEGEQLVADVLLYQDQLPPLPIK